MAAKISEIYSHIFGRGRGNPFKGYNPMKIYYHNYWIFVLSGFWRYDSPKKWKKTLYKLYKNLVKFVYGVSLTFFVIDAFMVRNDLDKLSFNMSSSVLVLMKVLEIALLSRLRSEMEDIYDKLNNNLYVDNVGESEEDQEILREKAARLVHIAVMFYGLLLMGMPLRIIADTAWDTRGYLIPMPFREKLDRYYEYLYAQQVIVSFHFMMTTLSYDLLGFTFLVRFIAHYEIIKKNILKIKVLYPKVNFERYVKGYVDGEENESGDANDVLIRKTNYTDKMENFLKNYKLRRFSLVKWVDREQKTFELLKGSLNHHQKLLAEIHNFSNIFSRPLLVQVCGMVLLSGITALQLIFLSNEINPLFIQQLIYSLTTVMNIMYLSSFGSELTSKSMSAANALYDTPWYEMTINNRKTLFLILKKLVNAPTLKGGGMITIDRVMCVKFMQSSYNMVALLRNKI